MHKPSFALRGSRRLLLARHQDRAIADYARILGGSGRTGTTGIVARFFSGSVMEYAANSSLEDDHHLDPRQMRRQGAAITLRRLAFAARLSVGGPSRIDYGLRRAERLSDILQRELQLIGASFSERAP